jgi:hypothetical protein
MRPIAQLVLMLIMIAVLAMYFFGERFEVIEQPKALSFEEFAKAQEETNAENDAAAQPDAEDRLHQMYQSYLSEWQEGQSKPPTVSSTSAIGKIITGGKASWRRVYAAFGMQGAAKSPGIKRILARLGVWVTLGVLGSGIIATNIAIGHLERKARK